MLFGLILKLFKIFTPLSNDCYHSILISLTPSVLYPILIDEIARLNGEKAGLNAIYLIDSKKGIRRSQFYIQLRSLFGNNASSEIKFTKTMKLEVLSAVIQQLEQSSIRPFLSFGTLLGFIREGGFMNHDMDLDIGIFHDETGCDEVYQKFNNGRFKIVLYEPDPWPCRLKVIVPTISDKLTVDIVFFKKEGNKLLTYSRILDKPIIRRRQMFGLVRRNIGNLPVWIPDPPEVFLDENYTNWDKKSDFHHYILTSPLTDFKSDLVRYFLSASILNATLGNSHNLIHLQNISMDKYSSSKPWLNPFMNNENNLH